MKLKHKKLNTFTACLITFGAFANGANAMDDATLIDLDGMSFSIGGSVSYDLTMDTNLTGANLFDAELIGANLSGVTLTGANLGFSDLTGTTLTDANLTNVNFGSAILNGSDLIGADLADTNLQNADFIDADLSGVDLSNNQTIIFANFSSATLSNVNFTGASLGGSNLTSATLINANFTSATVTGVDLDLAVLTNANFTNANIQGADLSDAVDFDGAIFSNTLFNSATDFSAGFDPATNPGLVLEQIPEPSSALLLGIGGFLFATRRVRK